MSKRDTIVLNLKQKVEDLEEQLRRQRKARIELEEELAFVRQQQVEQARRAIMNGVGR
jgi:hypothetical protein